MGTDLAIKLGIFFGTVLGQALKICGPVLEEILERAIRRAIKDTAEVSAPNAGLERMWDKDDIRPAGDQVRSAEPDQKR